MEDFKIPPIDYEKLAAALPRDVLTVQDLRWYLKLSAPTIRALLREGTIPGVKLAGKWRVGRRNLLRALYP